MAHFFIITRLRLVFEDSSMNVRLRAYVEYATYCAKKEAGSVPSPPVTPRVLPLTSTPKEI